MSEKNEFSRQKKGTIIMSDDNNKKQPSLEI